MNTIASIAIHQDNYEVLTCLIANGLNIEENIDIGEESNTKISSYLAKQFAKKNPKKVSAIATFIAFKTNPASLK